MADEIHTPVLIVGGGPVGLALAIDLGWRGIACTLVEQGDGSIAHPRANAENARTMEFFRRWGIADDVRASRHAGGLSRTPCSISPRSPVSRSRASSGRDTAGAQRRW